MRRLTLIALCTFALPGGAAEPVDLARHLLFHASFDESVDADVARGDRRMYTADSLERTGIRRGLHVEGVTLSDEGRFGGSLSFRQKTEAVVLFRGGANVPYAADHFEGTVSLWMRLSPGEDLPPGYVDPLQITDKTWNDASMFVDFTDVNPRQFRLGIFSDYKFWNPTARDWDDIAESERPMVTVKQPPFARDEWTHVAFVFSDFNAPQDAGDAALYLNGKLQGRLQGKQHFTWNRDEVVILLGINYVGGIDELSILDRALDESEIQRLFAREAD